MPDERRARRALLIFRLTFYPAALALAIVLLVARGGDAEPDGLDVKKGTTDQGESIRVNFDGDRATFFDTHIAGTCPSGRPWKMRWFPGDGDPVPFEQRDGRLRVTEPGEHTYPDGVHARWRMSMQAEIGADSMRGTMSMRTRFTTRYGDEYHCDAESVRFSVQR